jgi:hypothetical protein
MTRRFSHADRRHLALHVPLVHRARDVEAFVALQPDQLAPEPARERLGELGLADAGFAFEEQGDVPVRARGRRRWRAAVAR